MIFQIDSTYSIKVIKRSENLSVSKVKIMKMNKENPCIVPYFIYIDTLYSI